MRILIVDDSRSVHTFVKKLLQAMGTFEVVDAFHGSEGLKILNEDKKFDFVLLDWEMPVLDGPSTFQEIKRLKIDIPVMMMTSKNKQEEINQMLKAGVSEYIIKPFTEDIFRDKITMITGYEVAS